MDWPSAFAIVGGCVTACVTAYKLATAELRIKAKAHVDLAREQRLAAEAQRTTAAFSALTSSHEVRTQLSVEAERVARVVGEQVAGDLRRHGAEGHLDVTVRFSPIPTVTLTEPEPHWTSWDHRGIPLVPDNAL